MADLLVSTIIFKGVSYLITAVNVMNTVRFYSEVQHKISFIWMRKPPSKKEISATMTILNHTTEATGNMYMVYESVNNDSNSSKKDKTYKKKKTHKLKSQPKDIHMGKKSRIVSSILDFANDINVFFIRRSEAARKRYKKRLFDHDKKEEEKRDKKEQRDMNKIGYVRCEKFCKFYTHPTRM